MNRRRLIGATMLSLVLTVSNVPMVTVRATEDTSVSNKADFSTDVVYQIVTDRFVDGDSQNNPQGEIFNKLDKLEMNSSFESFPDPSHLDAANTPCRVTHLLLG